MKNIIKFLILVTFLSSFGFCNSTNTERIGLRINQTGQFESYLYLYNQKNIYNIDTNKSNQCARNLNHYMERYNLNISHLVKKHFFFDKNVLHKQLSKNIFDVIVKVIPPSEDITIDLRLKENTIIAAHVSASNATPDTFDLLKTRWDCLAIHLFHFFNDYKTKHNIAFYFPNEVIMNFIMKNPLTSNLLPRNYEEVCKNFFETLLMTQRDSVHSYIPLPTYEVSLTSQSSSSLPPQTIVQGSYNQFLHQQGELEKNETRHKIPYNTETQGNLLPPISDIFQEIKEQDNEGQKRQTTDEYYTNVALPPLYFPVSSNTPEETNVDITVRTSSFSPVTLNVSISSSKNTPKRGRSSHFTWVTFDPSHIRTPISKSTRKTPYASYCHEFHVDKMTRSDPSNLSLSYPIEPCEKNSSSSAQQTNSHKRVINDINAQPVPSMHSYASGDVFPDSAYAYNSTNSGSTNDIAGARTSVSHPIPQVEPFQHSLNVCPQSVGSMPFTYTNQSFSGSHYPSHEAFSHSTESHNPTMDGPFGYYPSNIIPVPPSLPSSFNGFSRGELPQSTSTEQLPYNINSFSKHFK